VLDAFSVEVLNRMKAQPCEGNALAHLCRCSTEVYEDWRHDRPEMFSKFAPFFDRWMAHELANSIRRPK
jgi:hypothetical protein